MAWPHFQSALGQQEWLPVDIRVLAQTIELVLGAGCYLQGSPVAAANNRFLHHRRRQKSRREDSLLAAATTAARPMDEANGLSWTLAPLGRDDRRQQKTQKLDEIEVQP